MQSTNSLIENSNAKKSKAAHFYRHAICHFVFSRTLLHIGGERELRDNNYKRGRCGYAAHAQTKVGAYGEPAEHADDALKRIGETLEKKNAKYYNKNTKT